MWYAVLAKAQELKQSEEDLIEISRGKKKGKKTQQTTATKFQVLQMLVRKVSLVFPLQSILQEIQP